MILTYVTASNACVSVTAEPVTEYGQMFYRESGWLGADGDYSVSLGPERLLWLFSDTFVGKIKDGHRVDTVMINNSVGIQKLKTPASIEYYYRKGAKGTPVSYITPDDGRGYFWLFDGIRTSKGLYLFLMRVETVNPNAAFGFRSFGTSLGHVENPDDSPDKWRITQRAIPYSKYPAEGSLHFGSAIMKESEYVYLYGLDSTRTNKEGKRERGMILARVPEDKLGDFDKWRFYSNGKWGTDFTTCSLICPDIPSEFSVSYQKSIKQYVLTYTEGGIFGTIVVRLASKPMGPWGDPIAVYTCPDHNLYKETFSYAAKAHPELPCAPNELIVSCITNTTNFSQLFDDARLYWPHFIRLTFENKDTR